jgi:hypothetical protein
MASTYTSNVGIEKPGSGEQAGTWGTTTNSNFDIIDQALHGQAQITITGSQDLNTNDGSTSDGANTVLVLTGTPGSTFELRVTPTDQEKFYTIKNETNGACRVIYKGVTYSTSNGVEILAGASAAVTGDGGGGSGKFKSLTPTTDVVNDTSPELGGNLDVRTYDIVTTSANRDIEITPHGTGSVILDGLSYPQADGSAGQLLKTDGSGQLAFVSAGSSFGNTLSLTGGSGWTISVDGSNNLVFSYGGSAKAKVATTGAITTVNDVTAYGSI